MLDMDAVPQDYHEAMAMIEELAREVNMAAIREQVLTKALAIEKAKNMERENANNLLWSAINASGGLR